MSSSDARELDTIAPPAGFGLKSLRVIAAITDDGVAPAVLAGADAIAEMACADTEALHVGHENPVLGQAARELGMTLRTLAGNAVEAILDACAAEDVAALVIGARASSVAARAVGATTSSLITMVDKPVVVVPPNARVVRRIERVLVPMNGTTPDGAALRQVTQLALGLKLEVVVAHVSDRLSLPAFSDHAPHEVRAWQEEFLARHGPAAPDARLELRVGDAREHLLEILDRTGCELVALSWNRDLSGGHAEVVRSMMAESPVPVLLTSRDRELHALVGTSSPSGPAYQMP